MLLCFKHRLITACEYSTKALCRRVIRFVWPRVLRLQTIEQYTLKAWAAFEATLFEINSYATFRPAPKPRIETHPKLLSKYIENASLAALFNHLWVGCMILPSLGPITFVLIHTVPTLPALRLYCDWASNIAWSRPANIILRRLVGVLSDLCDQEYSA